MNLSIEIDREEDGRWIAEVARLPGVLAYGQTRQEAIERVEALSSRVLADRLEHGEPPVNVSEARGAADPDLSIRTSGDGPTDPPRSQWK